MGVWRLHLASSPYPAEALDEVDFVQSYNDVYFVHLDQAPKKLTRSDHVSWSFDDVAFGPVIAAPANVAATPTQPNSTDAIATDYIYYVTAVDVNGQESRKSTGDTAINDMSLQGNYNTITWDSVATASFYSVYRGDNDAPGYVGMVQAPTTTFKDRNLISILSDTPPLATNPFTDNQNYPSTVTFHQQRLMLGRTRARPNAVWGSQSADPDNMDVSRPAKPDDALSFALLTDKVNAINQMVSMKEGLIILGSDSIFSITGGEGGAMTPAAIEPSRENNRGSSRLAPIVVDKVIFYQPSKANGIRALGFTFEIEGYRSNNVTIFSPHFFKANRLVDMTYQNEPYSCIWAVRDDGALLCFTWEEEQQVWGWTLMEIDGFVERVAVIHEGGYDRLYALIRRTIHDVERRFHERLALPHFDDIATACHLDCAVTQISAEPEDVIDQLWHLEGMTVSAIYDGYVAHDLVVEGGQVTLPHTAYVRTAGLRYTGTIQTLPLVLATAEGSAHTERQIVGETVIRALETRGLELSTDGENFDPLPERFGTDVWELPEAQVTDYQAIAPGNWTEGSTLTIRQEQPLPAHIVGIFADVKVSVDD